MAIDRFKQFPFKYSVILSEFSLTGRHDKFCFVFTELNETVFQWISHLTVIGLLFSLTAWNTCARKLPFGNICLQIGGILLKKDFPCSKSLAGNKSLRVFRSCVHSRAFIVTCRRPPTPPKAEIVYLFCPLVYCVDHLKKFCRDHDMRADEKSIPLARN